MNADFPALTVKRKTGDEPFRIEGHAIGFTLLNFWQWLASDLVDNALRGALAEYIVANTLAVKSLPMGVLHAAVEGAHRKAAESKDPRLGGAVEAGDSKD